MRQITCIAKDERTAGNDSKFLGVNETLLPARD